MQLSSTATLASHSFQSQPLLSHSLSDNNGFTAGGGGGGGGWRSSLAGPRQPKRLHSYDDLVLAARDGEGNDDDGGIEAYFNRCHSTPGYVSFEDVIHSAEFKEDMSRRSSPEACVISDPLVRSTSRLYATRVQPRHRRRSPGPLGTRRGGAMYRLIKKYVLPCLGFVADIIRRTG
ncbi:uncharacterized protein LOC121054223 [Oryza brachyantha]|uniref:Uncharacterized protein n=1 Tax=Oryza brachyantha TaxID=4533 RepID=J3LXQ4_ORYBR|nr:uncharacterized protein LOC121054223 [Oryza brachyantha]